MERHEHLMAQTVSLLAARDRSGLRINVGRDYYGRQWIEIRWGLLGQRMSRLGISPRYIAMLGDALADRDTAEEMA